MFSIAAAGSRRTFRKPSHLPPSETPAAPAERRRARFRRIAATAPDAAESAPSSPKTPLRWAPSHKICARIDEELVALEALKLPKFLRIDVFVWPFLLLAGGLIAGLGLGTGVGWTPAAIVGRGRRPGRGDRGLYWPGENGSPRRGAAMPCRLRKAIAEADQLVEQNKDWVKTEFESKLRELDKNRETKVRDAEEEMARRVAEFQEPPAKADRRGGPDLPGQARRDPPAPRRGQ